MEGKKANIVELDVRPLLRQNQEPFAQIMEVANGLGPNDIFMLHATFKPTPLLDVMRVKGFVHIVERKDEDHWVAAFADRRLGPELSAMFPHLEVSSALADPTPDDGGGTPEADSTAPRQARTIRLDNRGLEPPQPMIRTLAALERCRSGDEVLIHNDRVPVFLFDELKQLGYSYTVDEQPDGSAKVSIRKK